MTFSPFIANPFAAFAEVARAALTAGPEPAPPARQSIPNPFTVAPEIRANDEEPERLTVAELLRQIRNATLDPFSDKEAALREIRDLIDTQAPAAFLPGAAGGAPVGSSPCTGSPTGAPDLGDAA